MRQVSSDQIGAFAAIYDENVEIVSVARPQSQKFEHLFEQLIKSRQIPEIRWIQEVDDFDAPAREMPATIDADVCSVLSEQIVEVGEVMGELLACERVGVRIESPPRPPCPRFHVDRIPCRMLITLYGPGTDWISNPDVDWSIFEDLSASLPPIRKNRQIKRLETGHWSLLKGGGWTDQYRGTVHRSPHVIADRLLLALDPIF